LGSGGERRELRELRKRRKLREKEFLVPLLYLGNAYPLALPPVGALN